MKMSAYGPRRAESRRMCAAAQSSARVENAMKRIEREATSTKESGYVIPQMEARALLTL
jgi:hypothetical protein